MLVKGLTHNRRQRGSAGPSLLIPNIKRRLPQHRATAERSSSTEAERRQGSLHLSTPCTLLSPPHLRILQSVQGPLRAALWQGPIWAHSVPLDQTCPLREAIGPERGWGQGRSVNDDDLSIINWGRLGALENWGEWGLQFLSVWITMRFNAKLKINELLGRER